ncbi:MAG TPA: DNA-3-methyladenine glycosylase I [Acidimicrobiia bacterium]
MPDVRTGADGVARCRWAGDDPLMVAYHDDEWGVPHHDDDALFELLVLEGAQAGLSWSTILRKREGYRDAFAGFDVERVARFDDRDVTRLLGDARIVRNRQKVDAAIDNARALLDLRQQTGASLDAFLWSYVDGAPVVNQWTEMGQIPAVTETSTRLSKDLRKRGFRFVGPTTLYAFMQATGMVDDHVVDCFVRTR